MMIHFHILCTVEDPLWPLFLDTYTSSFPIDEQRPIDKLAQLLYCETRFQAMALIDNSGNFLGILTTWTFGTFIYIEHFALHCDLRSQGYGSIALQTFIHSHSLPIILEVEPPIDADTRRRVQFYKRCGLELYDFDYIQPPYSPELSSVPLRLMGTLPEIRSLEEIATILHREVYGVK